MVELRDCMVTRAFAWVLVLLVAWLAVGCGGAADPDGASGPPAGAAEARTPPSPPSPPEPVLARPELPAERVERGRKIVEAAGCSTCHSEYNQTYGNIPMMAGIGYRVWKWKNGSMEDAKGWLVGFLTFPKEAQRPPWRRQGGRSQRKARQPGYGLKMSADSIEDMAYYLLSLWDIP